MKTLLMYGAMIGFIIGTLMAPEASLSALQPEMNLVFILGFSLIYAAMGCTMGALIGWLKS